MGLTVGAMLGAVAAGCTSTQEKARELAQSGSEAFEDKGVRVTAVNRNVQVLSTSLVTDSSGTAAVVRLRSRSRKRFARLPIAIDIRGSGGRSVFRNDAPGLEPSLASIALLEPGKTVTWVNDQITPSGPARTARARIGGGKAATTPPRLDIEDARVGQDGGSAVASGIVRNGSRVEQRDLVVYAVARRGSKIVAAGRGIIRRLAPGRRRKFTAFLIGRPRGARLEVSAPPTVLKAQEKTP